MEHSTTLPPRLDIYKASAGSGKTFLLTLQYLKLLLESPTKYREILAVTFTNKATEEMKHRILGELKNLAAGKKTHYGELLLASVENLTQQGLQAHAYKVYASILHDYSRFAISTIDSFVQRIIRSFAYEIGLDAGFKLQLNADAVKEDLTVRLYNLLDINEPLRDWVVEMASARLGDGKNWDFKSDMMELAGELFKERFQGFDAAMQQLTEAERTSAFHRLRDHVHAATSKFESEQVSMGKTGVAHVMDSGLEPTDFHYGKSGFINHFYKAADKASSVAGTRVKEFLEKPDKVAAGKAPEATKSIIQGITHHLHNLMVKMVTHYDENIKPFNTALAIKQNLYTLQLMQVFSNELANYRSENNALLIGDTHLLLRELSSKNEASFIFEKTGNRYNHFLIDEFQDTSVFQWENFRPLLENALSQGQYNLIVGDVKQAIYRWRSGDWRLLLTEVKKQLRFFDIKESSLQDNYRSARPIIDFNNFLFATIPKRLQQKFNDEMDDAPLETRQRLEDNGYFHIIEDAYSDSFQKTPDQALDNGLVTVEFLGGAEDDDGSTIAFKDQVLERLPILVESLIKEKGYAPKDITILTRGNREARELIHALMTHQQNEGAHQYNLISADALFISANEAVQVVIAAMRWLVNKTDTLSKAFLVKTMAQRNGTKLSQHQLFASNGSGEQLLPPSFIQNRALLQALPVLDLINSLIDIFSLQHYPADHAYLLAFQDVALDWNRFGEDGLLAFLRYWDSDGAKKSLPSARGTDAVEVMTIHKSKGLAFEVLILPFCDWALEPDAKMNNWLWVKTQGTPFHEVPFVPVKYKKALAQSDFAYEYFEEQLLSQMDSLNMLYVATTRARQQIIAFAGLPKKDKSGNYAIRNIGDLMYNVLDVQQDIPNQKIPNVADDFRNDLLLFGAEPGPDNSGPETPASCDTRLGNVVYADWRQQLLVRPAGQLLDDEVIALPRSKGSLLHHALSALHHPDELEIILTQMMMKGIVHAALKDEMKNILEKVLAHDLLIPWKNRTHYRLSERDIVTDQRQLRRPDLILMNDAETFIIDFKFSDAKDSHTIPQIKTYMELLAKMDLQNIKGYIFYGLSCTVDEVTI